MVVLQVAGWFASPAISKLYDLASLYLRNQYHYQKGEKSKLERLQRSLRKIGAVIETVETRGIEDNPNLVWWLNDLRDVAYDAEDVLDLLDYKRLKDRELIDKGGKVRKLVKQAKTVAKRVIFLDDALNELSEVVDKLDVLANNSEITTLLGVVNSRPANINNEEENDKNGDWRHTAATPSASKVFDRGKEFDRLQKLLLESSDASGSSCGGNFSVVSIIGMGGVGKTTLAQTVYNDADIESHFDLKAWVCISDRPFDFRKVMIEIMESASAKKENELEKVAKLREIQNLDAFQQHFEKTLEGKRFLIVLDDVWDETRSHWDKLYSTFRSAKQGSKILSTTRNQGVVDSMKSSEKMKLEGLEEAEFWKFFKCCAFGDANAEDHPELERIGKQIVKHLGCSPLAAKTLGAVLNLDLKVKHWSKILEDKSWQNNEDGISASLKLSYHHLPTRLKQCFVYCALFPKDYEFEKERLVHIWVALGYVQSSNGKKTLEDVGQEYFDELEHRCFFQKMNSNYYGYVVHDLLHDLAESLSKEEFYRQEEDKLETLTIPETVRHLFVSCKDLDGVLDKIQNTKRLRSLVHETPLFSSSKSEATSLKLKTTFTKLSGLRILILGRYYSSPKFDVAINDMPHLRYLEFPPQMDLPFMGGLHHLQVLAHRKFNRPDPFNIIYGASKWGDKS